MHVLVQMVLLLGTSVFQEQKGVTDLDFQERRLVHLPRKGNLQLGFRTSFRVQQDENQRSYQLS